jgi:hypothetical protein
METRFDASIDLTDRLVPPGADPYAAISRVRTAVEALPGSGWVSMEWCASAPGSSWLRLYRPGYAEAMAGGEWDALGDLVEGVVREAVAEASPR